MWAGLHIIFHTVSTRLQQAAIYRLRSIRRNGLTVRFRRAHRQWLLKIPILPPTGTDPRRRCDLRRCTTATCAARLSLQERAVGGAVVVETGAIRLPRRTVMKGKKANCSTPVSAERRSLNVTQAWSHPLVDNTSGTRFEGAVPRTTTQSVSGLASPGKKKVRMTFF